MRCGILTPPTGVGAGLHDRGRGGAVKARLATPEEVASNDVEACKRPTMLGQEALSNCRLPTHEGGLAI